MKKREFQDVVENINAAPGGGTRPTTLLHRHGIGSVPSRDVIKMLLPVMILGFVSSVIAITEAPSFERYQVILNRKPFGDPPPAPVQAKPPPPRPDSFAKSLRLSMIVETDEGDVRIGFVDNRTSKSYSLVPGEAQDGIELISASFEEEEAIIQSGEEMALLKLASGTFEEIRPEDQEARIEAARNRPSYAERRRARMEKQREQEKIPETKYKGEELTEHLYEYQMEIIRQGLPPLPIPLTQEQDDQLVAEGYLAPAE